MVIIVPVILVIRIKLVISEPQVCTSGSTSTSVAASASAPSSGDFGGPIRATTPMWRCSRVMHVQRDNQTTVLSSLEGIVDQVTYQVFFLDDKYTKATV